MTSCKNDYKESLFGHRAFVPLPERLPVSLIKEAVSQLNRSEHLFAPYSGGDMKGWDRSVIDSSNTAELPALHHLINEYLPFDRITQARVFRMKPGGWLGWHTECWEDQSSTGNGEIVCTINVPLTNPPGCTLSFQTGEQQEFSPGEAFLINFSQWHCAQNRGESVRLHAKVSGVLSMEALTRLLGESAGVSCWDQFWPHQAFGLKYLESEVKRVVAWADGLVGERMVSLLSHSPEVELHLFHTFPQQLDWKRGLYEGFSGSYRAHVHARGMHPVGSDSEALTQNIWYQEPALNEFLSGWTKQKARTRFHQVTSQSVFQFLMDAMEEEGNSIFWLDGCLSKMEEAQGRQLLARICEKSGHHVFTRSLNF